MKAFAFILLAFFTVTISNGCKNKTDLDANGVPQTLKIGIFGGENPGLVKSVYEPIRQYLSRELHMPVEIIYTTDYTAVIEALKAKKVHMADLSPFSYIIAKKNTAISPIIVLGADGKPSMYSSSIITAAHSGINSMADVKARSKSLTLCFVEPASASGHLIPRAYLNTIGLNPDTAFKQTLFAGGHLASVFTVKSGKVDLGCTSKMIMDIMASRGMIKDGDMRILWTSPPIVSEPVVVRNDLGKDFIKKIQDAYLNMDKHAPEVLHNYLKVLLKDNSKLSYMVAQDSFYNGLRKIAGGVKDLKLAN